MLKIIAGPDANQEFACGGAETYVGRSQRCVVRLSSTAVSFEHALITRAGDEFHVENLSANGTLINGQRLLAKTRLRLRDQLQMGDTVARVEHLPAAATAGSGRRLLLLAVVAVMLLAMVLVIADPFSTTTSRSTASMYHIFQQYVQYKQEHGDVPADVMPVLAEAWRLQASGNRDQAVRQWVKLQVVLDKWDRDENRDATADSTAGLRELESGQRASLPDSEMRVALKQWVVQMERGQ